MAPSVNLALHLRLARILTGRSVAGEAHLGPEALQCLAVLDDLMGAMDERAELLRLPESVESVETAATEMMTRVEVEAVEAEAEPEVEIEASEAVAEVVTDIGIEEVSEEFLPEAADSAPTLAMEVIPDGPTIWGSLHDQLYEDVLWLFKMGDNEGALNSLARLMDFGSGTEELERFLTINSEKLFDLYHRLVGDPETLVERQDAVIGDRYFFHQGEVETLLEQVDGARPLGEIVEASDLPELKVYAYLHRIRREGLIRVHRSDA